MHVHVYLLYTNNKNYIDNNAHVFIGFLFSCIIFFNDWIWDYRMTPAQVNDPNKMGQWMEYLRMQLIAIK